MQHKRKLDSSSYSRQYGKESRMTSEIVDTVLEELLFVTTVDYAGHADGPIAFAATSRLEEPRHPLWVGDWVMVNGKYRVVLRIEGDGIWLSPVGIAIGTEIRRPVQHRLGAKR